MSTCPVTIHALLHIADSIKTCGPVCCYWAFPMERYCNRLKPAIKSRWFPYAAIDRYILEDVQLTQIKVIYNLVDELSLKPTSAKYQKNLWGLIRLMELMSGISTISPASCL